ncbi:hypothetical protein L4X63_12945 [Geomonas sp. Red32]|uniref:hypothetical protein n=1 Tax=Geomonas sp. Red32 TaxID=2912856 RepID=UPI00202CE6AA|nr:hypothetical protein [Geomonas sp. Red32]MCM0082499.1 hypothetical protein [Geomonas sp. Red32]
MIRPSVGTDRSFKKIEQPTPIDIFLGNGWGGGHHGHPSFVNDRELIERVRLNTAGEKMVAIIPIEDLELLEAIEDRLDVEAAKAALAESDERVSYHDLRREHGLE